MRMVTVRVLMMRESSTGDVWVVVEKSYPGMRVLPSALIANVVCSEMRTMITTTMEDTSQTISRTKRTRHS
jgi:hypothetical protein